MTTTPNLHLTMDDEETDLYSVVRVNENTEKIDQFAGRTAARLLALEEQIALLDARVTALEGGGT